MRQSIAQQLFADQDFHDYVCKEQRCTVQSFLEGIVFREEVLRVSPRTTGCIVGPRREAMTRIYAVMVLEGQAPSLALTFMGVHLGIDPKAAGPGFKDLVATEKKDASTWLTHRYAWTGTGYALHSTQREQ